MVGVIEALTHPTKQTERLLDMSLTWATTTLGKLPPAHSYRTMPSLRPDEVDDLVAGYQAGASVGCLARQFNIHRSTVGRHLQARGINTRTPGLQPDQVATAVDLYRAGWSLMKIAVKLEASATTIRRYLAITGVMLRGPHERVRSTQLAPNLLAD